MADTKPAMEPEPTPDASSPALEYSVTTEAATPEGAAPVPEPEPTAAETVATEVVESDAEPAATRRPLRTPVLLVAAVLLGPLSGAGVGYAIQAARPATPLPPLKAAQPHYPAAPADAQAVAAALPKPLNIDGDLRKLLINKPDGAEDWDNYGHGDEAGWLSISAKADSYGNADREFRDYLADGFRRDAFVAWKKGDTKYRVELLQYDDDNASSAGTDLTRSSLGYGGRQTIPGTLNGVVVVATKPDHYADSTETFYPGEAIARRGTLVMHISVFSPNQVNAEELKDLAKRQWERLV